MRCPVDGTTLALAERAGLEIDYCPQCRGVGLDRGELNRTSDATSTTVIMAGSTTATGTTAGTTNGHPSGAALSAR